jgi:hypothetical protein
MLRRSATRLRTETHPLWIISNARKQPVLKHALESQPKVAFNVNIFKLNFYSRGDNYSCLTIVN